MKILVDADACPVVKIIEEIAREFNVSVILLCDTNHIISSDYSDVKVIDAGADAVDLALINLCKPNDIVVTQDYGVAALALSKNACAIHQNGNIYTDENISGLLNTRYINKKQRMSKGKTHIKGPKKRTKENDINFSIHFRNLLKQVSERYI